jgi:hypothetical protein
MFSPFFFGLLHKYIRYKNILNLATKAQRYYDRHSKHYLRLSVFIHKFDDFIGIHICYAGVAKI